MHDLQVELDAMDLDNDGNKTTNADTTTATSEHLWLKTARNC